MQLMIRVEHNDQISYKQNQQNQQNEYNLLITYYNNSNCTIVQHRQIIALTLQQYQIKPNKHTIQQMPAVSSSNISVNTPSLQTQLLNKINILFDKPISPLSTKQLIELIKHESSPKEKIFLKLFGKYRGDLIVVMLQLYPYLLYTNKKLPVEKLLEIIRADIMHYDIRIVEQLWAVVMEIILGNQEVSVEERHGQVYSLGYEELLKDGLRVTNLEKKDRLFEVIEDNVAYMWRKGLKQAMRKVAMTYVEVFVKYPLAVSSYVKTMRRILEIIEQANKNDRDRAKDIKKEYNGDKREQGQQGKNSDNKQQTDSLEQIPQSNNAQQQLQQPNQQLSISNLPNIPINSLTLILSQCLNLLKTTSSKPLHILHSQCMLLIQQILKTAGKQILGGDSGMKYELDKLLEVYLYRKGVRDEARRVVAQVKIIEKKVADENRLKMVKGYGDQVSQRGQGERPLGEVIAKTNNYLLKYQLNEMGNQGNLSQLDNLMLQKSNIKFLKRGQGQGGGKTVLQLQQQQKTRHNSHKTKDKYVSQYSVSYINRSNVKMGREGYAESVSKRKADRIESMLESCLRKGWGVNDNSKGEQKRQSRKEERREIGNRGSGNNKSEESEKKQYEITVKDKQLRSQKPTRSNMNPTPTPKPKPFPLQLQQSLNSQFSQQYQCQPHPHIQTNNTSTISQQQVNQINQLIDLAYSYKFSL